MNATIIATAERDAMIRALRAARLFATASALYDAQYGDTNQRAINLIAQIDAALALAGVTP